MISIVFGLGVGLALGLTGGGGSIFAVPLLIYGLGIAPKSAVVMSLGAVAATAAVGAAESWRRGALEWRAALIFAAASVLTAPVGVWLGGYVDETIIVLLFALLMCVVALRMGFKAWRTPDESKVVRARLSGQANTDPGTVCRYSNDGRLRLNAPCSLALTLSGALVGVLSGFLGVGGGFLIVPSLVLITEMGIHRAVATSLLIITLTGLSGLGSALVVGRAIDISITALFVLGGVLGMYGGRLLAYRLAGRTLQMIFATAMSGIAIFIFAKHWF